MARDMGPQLFGPEVVALKGLVFFRLMLIEVIGLLLRISWRTAGPVYTPRWVARCRFLEHWIDSADRLYVHVMADALTSVLALSPVLAGRFYGLDPVMVLIGTVVILTWSWNLVRSAGAVLLDTVPDTELANHVREHLEVNGDRVSDPHLWRLGPGHMGVIAAFESDRPQNPDEYKRRLTHIAGLAHVTIEVHEFEITREDGGLPADYFRRPEYRARAWE